MESLDSAIEQIKKKAVKETVDAMIREQINVTAGSKILYERIDSSFKEVAMDPYFLKEQWELYDWRERFFGHYFPQDCWYTGGGDDAHGFDTVPFQITTNFESLMTMAASMNTRQCKGYGDQIFLECDEEISNSVRRRWEVFPKEEGFDYETFREIESFKELSFSFTAHQIAELHPKGPRKLEELAMRAVLRNGLSLVEMSRELKEKSVKGMYDLEDDAPVHINNVGKKYFKRVQKLFKNIETDDSDSSSPE